MGKTAAGAVWLNAERVSPWDYWQFWRNTEDADVSRFLRLFTELPLDEVKRLESLKGAELNEAKKRLATEATRLAHGDAAAKESEETARRTFEQGGASEGLPTIEIPRAELEAGVGLLDLIVRAKLAPSKGEAKRLVQQNGVRLNDEVVSDVGSRVGLGAFAANGVAKLSAGRKKHTLLKAV